MRAKLEKKWLAEFLQTPEYKARSGEVAEGVEEGEGGVSGTIAATTRGPAVSVCTCIYVIINITVLSLSLRD